MLANTWIIPNSGGGPTPDKPEVVLETPSDLNRVNGFLSLRVADICACYKQWGDKGARFLTQPLDNHGWEWRCSMRDPDGYLFEVGQHTQMALDRFKSDPSEVARQLHSLRREYRVCNRLVSQIGGRLESCESKVRMCFDCAVRIG
jgi:hypothetical protein